jgi:RimJ/RimL family protein N-acetyltransferase
MEQTQYLLRKATEEDAYLYFDLYNQEDVKLNSFTHQEIAIEAHLKWYSSKMNCLDYELYVCEYFGEKAGILRIEDIKKAGELLGLISFSVLSKFQGKGCGTFILKEAASVYKKQNMSLIGEVKKENLGSMIAFEKSGYYRDSDDGSKVIFRSNR